jgi:hypothetical protein
MLFFARPEDHQATSTPLLYTESVEIGSFSYDANGNMNLNKSQSVHSHYQNPYHLLHLHIATELTEDLENYNHGIDTFVPLNLKHILLMEDIAQGPNLGIDVEK